MHRGTFTDFSAAPKLGGISTEKSAIIVLPAHPSSIVPSDLAQTVKQQADIVRVIGEYIRLKKSGAQNFSGLCPFHGEKTPSFSVHAVRQFYHCFGCGQHGDVFSFVQKIENTGFSEAVRIVAQKCGIALPRREFSSPEQERESLERRKLLDLHELATAWFEEQLRSPEGARAREYLTGRGVTAAAIQQFRIGYAPDSFGALRDLLQGAALPELLRRSGLFSSKEQEDGAPGPLYSRFRKRITFPIRNESGRTIAFTARALDADEKSGPKYLNSPETPLYSKGQVLFNLDKARQAIRQQDVALLVEGQMDCITAYMAGIQNVLASSGTAFSEAQARLLSRYTKRLIVNFDPDTAGANAAERSIALLTEEDFEIRVVTLEGGLDPDRFVRERGVKAYLDALSGARRHSDYLIDRAQKLFPSRTAEAKSKAVDFLLPHIRRSPNPIIRQDFAADAAQKLGIDSALMREELKRAAARKGRPAVAPKEIAVNEAERVLLRAMCSQPGSPLFLQAVGALEEQSEWFEGLGSAEMLHALRLRGDSEPLAAMEDPRQRALLASILLGESEPVDPGAVAAALETLRYRRLERQQRRIRSEIAEAERRRDTALISLLIAEKREIDRKMRESESI